MLGTPQYGGERSIERLIANRYAQTSPSCPSSRRDDKVEFQFGIEGYFGKSFNQLISLFHLYLINLFKIPVVHLGNYRF